MIEKMKNWGGDWIWHVRMYSICWINCQNLFRFSRILTFNEKWKIGVNIGKCHILDMEKLWYYPLVEWIVTIYPVFMEHIEKMENCGGDGVWHVRMYSIFWINCQNLFRFSRILTFNEKWKIVVNIGYAKLECIA